MSDLPEPGGPISRRFGTQCPLYIQPASRANEYSMTPAALPAPSLFLTNAICNNMFLSSKLLPQDHCPAADETSDPEVRNKL
jgi:hypothetical protein